MYKKYAALLIMANLILVTAYFSVKGIQINRLMATEAFQVKLAECFREEEEQVYWKTTKAVASGQRVVQYDLMKQEYVYQISEEDYEVLLRIVEAEAGGEDADGKLLVANVVLNRVESEDFPDTIKEVVFQRSHGTTQFSPVNNGRYYTVEVSEETVEAVDRALKGEDISEGALYFAARRHADPDRMRWFDEKLTFLFKHGGHDFFQ